MFYHNLPPVCVPQVCVVAPDHLRACRLFSNATATANGNGSENANAKLAAVVGKLKLFTQRDINGAAFYRK